MDPPHVVFGYLECPPGFGITQGSRDDWLVSKISDKLGKWKRGNLSIAGRIVVINHILGGLLNFYLGFCSFSKATIARINKIMRSFIWNKDSGRGIEVGWQWCILPREKGGLGISLDLVFPLKLSKLPTSSLQR